MLTTFNKELYEKNLKELATAEGLAEGRSSLLLEQIQKKLDKNMNIHDIAKHLSNPKRRLLQLLNSSKKGNLYKK